MREFGRKRASALVIVGLIVVPARADEKSARREASAQALIEALQKEQFDKAGEDFDATVTKLASTEKLKEIWSTLTKKVGALKKTDRVRTENKGARVLIRCQFEKAALDLRVNFNDKGEIAGFGFVPAAGDVKYKAPEYVKRATFVEKEVTFGEDEWKLPGTLSVPKGKGPFPGVVLLHGSGPHDRDESIYGAKVFRDLAWGLSSRGVAVLRFEKRTKEHGAKLAAKKVSMNLKSEVIDDALHAVRVLKHRDKIDAKRIFVLGHSLGATVAPKVGLESKDVAGLIMLAGYARPLEDVLYDQFVHFASADGKISEEEQTKLDELKSQINKVKSPDLNPKTPSKELPLETPAEYWLSVRSHRQTENAKRVKQPMLLLQGERDYQVTMKDFDLWKKTLKGKSNATLKSYPKLNHLFIAGEGRSMPSEYFKEGHVDKQVIEDVAKWITDR